MNKINSIFLLLLDLMFRLKKIIECGSQAMAFEIIMWAGGREVFFVFFSRSM